MLNFAVWLNKRLLVVDASGDPHAPGWGPKFTAEQPDGSEITIFANGDEFDLYLAGKRTVYNLTLTPEVGVELALWLLRWWFRQWFGLKGRLWRWSLNKILNKRFPK